MSVKISWENETDLPKVYKAYLAVGNIAKLDELEALFIAKGMSIPNRGQLIAEIAQAIGQGNP